MRRPPELDVLAGRFLESLRYRNYSERTVETRRHALTVFLEWCTERSISRPDEVTKQVLDRFQRHLLHYRRKNGRPLKTASRYSRLSAVRLFFRWMAENDVIEHNPAMYMPMPRMEHRLPRAVLTAAEADTVIAEADPGTPMGLRDRAILETLYSTGIRRTELCNLQLYDVNAGAGTLMVRQGKGKRDRVVPIGDRALDWLARYLEEVRPTLTTAVGDGPLFLTREGDPLRRHYLSDLVKRYVDQADIGKTGSCHLFRHTCATVMLEGGADIRMIQAQLGHTSLQSTQIYAHVAITKLKQVHTATHPARRRGSDAEEELLAALEEDAEEEGEEGDR